MKAKMALLGASFRAANRLGAGRGSHVLAKVTGLTAALLLCAVSGLPALPRARRAAAKNYQFVNGLWFDGRGFRARTLYSADGVLSVGRPPRVDEVIDLAGGYVVPPFADAHCHHFDGPYNVKGQIEMYLRDGVFYAKVQTDVRSGALKVAGLVNKPDSVDVSYAHGALTSSYGHGVEVYEGLALFRRPGAASAEEVRRLRESRLLADDAYYVIDTAADLERKWPKVIAGRPDFIKIYLLTSEEFEERKKRTDTVGDRGLEPKLVPLIVRKAHAAGLRVSAHVDTVTDYRIALRAGVDEMAHLPGYYVDLKDDPRRYELTEGDARETARRGTWIIPSPVAYEMFDPQSPSFNPRVKERTDAVRSRNLKLLWGHRVKIAFGSDRYGNTPVADVLYLHRLGVFGNLEMLKIWCEDTPRAVFPGRRIGRLRPGYEASFLVLRENPLVDFAAVKLIALRVKQGVLISPPNR
jgi:imidazolonepropionase-like amidohydrolase